MPVFTARVPGALKVGDRILIKGKIKENARKFSVNLCAEEGDEPRDVVLHFDVRFQRDNIISLSRKNGTWIGSGSYDTNCNLFVRGSYFHIVFELKDASIITVYCQHKFHSNFLPKIPLSAARFLVVWADVERVVQLDFYLGQHGNTMRDGVPATQSAPPGQMSQSPTHNMESPRRHTYVHTVAPCPESHPPRNRPPMCANEYPRLQKSTSGSSTEDLQRRDTEVTITERADTRSEISQNAESTCASSLTANLRKKGSFYSRARVPFQHVCNFVTKTRRTKRRM